MKHRLTFLAALAAAISIPAAAEEAPDRGALMQWGYTLAGNAESDLPLINLRAPLCLLVAADDPEFAAKVGKRIIANAREAGVRTKRGKCRPNAVIAFAPDAQGQLLEVREKTGRVYGSLYASQLDRLLETEREGFAFQLHDFQSADRPRGLVDNSSARADMAAALVVVDAASAEGLTVVQLADYATLRLLAPTGDLRTLPANADAQATTTILTLLRDREAAPAEMTRFDRAYLESLYSLGRGPQAKRVMARASKIALADEGM
ncbi:MAG: hypothetical protein EDM03_03105 [Porphyrobacter sp. IPPAS B-1204]|nr:MAG: hypothetical protein EDM03_03105 [Porphyrobacter sp. IPPAS B-1204]